MSDAPLIIVLLKYFFKLLGYVCSIVAIPITLFSLLVSAIINTDVSESSSKHFFICIPRILIVMPFWPAFLFLSYLYGYLISLAIEDHAKWVPFVIALGALFAIGIGYWFTRYASFLKNSMPDFKVNDYFSNLAEAIFDLMAVFALVVSIATVIRIPFMIAMMCTSKPTMRRRRLQIFLHFGFIFLDILALPLFLIEMITILRANAIFKYIKDEKYDTEDICFGSGLRLKIYSEIFVVLLEILVMIFSFVLLLAPWRVVIAFEKIKESKSNGEAFLKLFNQEANALLDILCLLLALIPMLSVYRGIILIYRVWTGDYDRNAKGRRIGVLWEIVFLAFDIVCLLFFIPLLLTVYRLPILFRKGIRNNQFKLLEFEFEICAQFLQFLLDIPHIFMFAVIMVTLWRAPFMIRDLFKGDNKKRKYIRHHFLFLFVDIIDFPFVIASFIILLTLWRAYLFVDGFKSLRSRRDQRVYVFRQFIEWLLDIPTAVAFLLLTITVYRLPETIRQLKLYYKNWKEDRANPVKTSEIVIPPPPIDSDNPLPNQGREYNTVHWRMIVIKQFVLVLIDIPFPILLILTLWRLPILIKRLKEITDPSRMYAQRRLLILRYLLYVLLDIVCAPVVLLCFVTIWRIPTFISIVKNYKRGDNEHKQIAFLFINMLIDIPFVLLGVVALAFPWRGIVMVMTIYKESKSDKESRKLAFLYFGLCILDIIALAIFLISCVIGPWRVIFTTRNIYAKVKDNLDKPSTRIDGEKERPVLIEDRFEKYLPLYYSVAGTFAFIVVDYFSAFQTLMITLFIRQARPFYKSVYDAYKKEDFELDDLIPLLRFYSNETLKDIPHIPLIPFKILGCIFLPIYLYMRKRRMAGFFQVITKYFVDICKDLLNYLGMDKVFIISMIGSLVIIPHEVGMLIAFVNCVYFFIVTLGSPLWNDFRKKSGWNNLGEATGFLSVVELIILVLQVLTFPAFVFLQAIILLLPILVSLGMYNLPERPGFAEFWRELFSSRPFWENSHRFNAGIWFLMAFWIFINVANWVHLESLSKRYFPLFSPLKSYYWLVKKVFAGRIWGFYKGILAVSTRICYRLRRACFLGELLMFPLFLIWTCWSFVIPPLVKIYYLFIPAGIISITLMVFAYRIVKDNWRSKPKGSQEPNLTPVMALNEVTLETPEEGGLIIRFQCRRMVNMTEDFTDVRLTMESEPLWTAIKSAIGGSKVSAGLFLVGYPISLTPNFLDLQEINKINENIDFSIKLGLPGSKFHLKKKVLVKFVNLITKVDNPPFEFILEYGKKDFGWKRRGIVLKFSTRLSELINRENNGILYHRDIQDIPVETSAYQYGNIPVPPPLPNSNKKESPKVDKKPTEMVGLQFLQNFHEVAEEVEVEEEEEDNTSAHSSPKIHVFYDEETGEEIILDDAVEDRYKNQSIN